MEAPATTGPQIYDASREMDKLHKTVVPPKRIVEQHDPLRSFAEDDQQRQTDIRLWMTNPSAKTRGQNLIRLLGEYEKELAIRSREQTPEEIAVHAHNVGNMRWRFLAAVVWAEGRPGGKGSLEVAEAAARAMFAKFPAPPEAKPAS